MENNEENKIQDGQVSLDFEIEKAEEEKFADAMPSNLDKPAEGEILVPKKEPSFRSHLALIFVLGFLIGIAFKTEALKRITIGYSDYLMKSKPQSYNINEIQTKLQKERDTAGQPQAQPGDAVDSEGATDSVSVPANSESSGQGEGNAQTGN